MVCISIFKGFRKPGYLIGHAMPLPCLGCIKSTDGRSRYVLSDNSTTHAVQRYPNREQTMAPLLLGANAKTSISLMPSYANRHGLITGTTGSGKTATLQGMAEGFSERGVPVFMADVKGDLAGLCQANHQLQAVTQGGDSAGRSMHFACCLQVRHMILWTSSVSSLRMSRTIPWR